MNRTLRVAILSSLASALTLQAVPVQAADPTMADCLSANETSLKLRRDRHLRDARQQLLVCAALTCPTEVRSECERRVREVNTAMPTLVFEAKDGAGNDLPSVSVTMDGKPLIDRLEGTALSLDPGEHAFHFETPGYAPVDKSFVLHEGEKDRRERVVFGGGASAGTAGSPGAKTEPAKGDHADVERSTSSWGPLKTVGVVVGGAGIVGLGVGAAFGLMASSDKSSASCAANNYCASQALSDARNHATIATAGFVGGGVLLAAGLGLVIFGPKSASVRVAPAVGMGSTGIVVGGSF